MSTTKIDLIFKALADNKRRKILDLLKDEPLTTGDICNKFKKINRCTVMQHLGVLEKAGLIIVKREGRTRWNYLDVAPIQKIYNRWIKDYAAPSADLLEKISTDFAAL